MKKITFFVFIIITIFLFGGVNKSEALSCAFFKSKYYIEYKNTNLVDAFKTNLDYSGGEGGANSCPQGKETVIELNNLNIAKEAFLNIIKANNSDISKLDDGIYEVICFTQEIKSCFTYKKLENVNSLQELKKEIPLKELKQKITRYLIIIPAIIFSSVSVGLGSVFNIGTFYFYLLVLFIIFFFFGIVVFFKKVRYLGFLLVVSLLVQISTFLFLLPKIISYNSYLLNKYATLETLNNTQRVPYIINILGFLLLLMIFFEIVYYIAKKIKNYKEKIN